MAKRIHAKNVIQCSSFRLVSDAEKSTWNSGSGGPHNHDDLYAPINHTHNGYAPVDHEHAGYALTGHNHDASYAAVGHTHNGVYEPANANIQTHIGSAHAPSTAQKNSDITKAEIEAKLTGEITSHTHPAGAGSDPFTAKLRLANDVSTAANVTPVNLTGMSFVYEANSVYKIEWYMAVTAAAATTGHGFGLNCTTAPVLTAGSGTSQLANTGTVTGWQFIANNAVVGVTSGNPTANAITPSLGQGILVTNAATGGTCQFIFRSEVAAVATCKAGSVITVMKIS